MKARTKIVFLLLSCLVFVEAAKAQYVPPQGFVPNAETAIAVARAILIPIYGADTIRREEPLVAEQKVDRWIVRGTLQCARPNTCTGGTAEIEIAKTDGRILRVIHHQ